MYCGLRPRLLTVPPMPQSSAERVADGLWRQLRPLFIEVIGAAMTEPEPAGDEERYIAERAAKQLERLRAPRRPTATRRRKPKP